MALSIPKQHVNPSGFYPQQIEALNKLYDWYHNPNSLEFVLKGFAGTGKTYIIKYFIKHIVSTSFCITAPTHKALRVIENQVGYKGKTLQSLHGLRPNTDLATFSIDNVSFDPSGHAYLQNYSLVMIDECSMIPRGLFKLNHDRSKEFNTKILYIGDPYQLPPVNELVSDTFARVVESFTLTEIVRQEEGNPLLELFSLLRFDIGNNKSTFLQHIIKHRVNMNETQGYELMNESKFKERSLELFDSPQFIADIDWVRGTAFTNTCVTKWNTTIRNALLENPKDILSIHDIITSYNTILDDFNNPIIINSEDYIIKNIVDYVDEFGIKTFCVNLQSIFDGRITTPFLIVDHTDKIGFAKYYKLLNYLHAQAYVHKKTNAWKNYYNVKNKLLTMVSFKLNEANGHKTVKKDIDHGYNLTTHKLQGSTFGNMVVDLVDIVKPTTINGYSMNNDPKLRNKLIYVALSRATNKVLLKY